MLSRAGVLGSRFLGLLNTGGVRGRQCRGMAGEARKEERAGEGVEKRGMVYLKQKHLDGYDGTGF